MLEREGGALVNEESSETGLPPTREDLRRSGPSVAWSRAPGRTSLCARILDLQPPECWGTNCC